MIFPYFCLIALTGHATKIRVSSQGVQRRQMGVDTSTSLCTYAPAGQMDARSLDARSGSNPNQKGEGESFLMSVRLGVRVSPSRSLQGTQFRIDYFTAFGILRKLYLNHANLKYTLREKTSLINHLPGSKIPLFQKSQNVTEAPHIVQSFRKTIGVEHHNTLSLHNVTVSPTGLISPRTKISCRMRQEGGSQEF